ncbi:MAG: hypothetical protein QM783_13355 [Phycisphaerales bacterium]
MYRIPKDLDLSAVVGEFTTQVCVGQFDMQFSFGRVRFAVTSPIELLRGGNVVARWQEGTWPDAGFFDVMNSDVRRCEVVTDRLIVLEFENGLEMHLKDDSDMHECIQIWLDDGPLPWVII